MKGKATNYKVFIPIGVCFTGAGVVFIAEVNPVIGIALVGVGVVWMIIGLKKRNQMRGKK